MRLIIDANVLFAALIKDSSTAQLLISDKLKFFAPEFLFEEFAKYEDYIQDLVEVLTTEEIINKVSSLKDEKEQEK